MANLRRRSASRAATHATEMEEPLVLGVFEHFFLYLPVFHAIGRDCFKRVAEGRIETKVIGDSDRDLYMRMMTSPITKGPSVILCDPVEVVRRPMVGGRSACVIGALVRNSAFVAVNHGSLGPIESLADLSRFQSLITYGEGTTGRGIARRIESIAGRAQTVVEVKPPREFDRFEKVTSDDGPTVMLTPELLDVCSLRLADTGVRVEMSIGSTKEYANHLVCALVTRSDVLTNYASEIAALRIAVEESLELCRRIDSDVVDFAADTYHQKPTVVREALNLARELELFPDKISIEQKDWISGLRPHLEEAHREIGAPLITDETLRNTFRAHVEPFCSPRLPSDRPGAASRVGKVAWPAKLTEAALGSAVLGGLALLALQQPVIAGQKTWLIPFAAACISFGVGVALLRFRPLEYRLREVIKWTCAIGFAGAVIAGLANLLPWTIAGTIAAACAGQIPGLLKDAPEDEQRRIKGV